MTIIIILTFSYVLLLRAESPTDLLECEPESLSRDSGNTRPSSTWTYRNGTVTGPTWTTCLSEISYFRRETSTIVN